MLSLSSSSLLSVFVEYGLRVFWRSISFCGLNITQLTLLLSDDSTQFLQTWTLQPIYGSMQCSFPRKDSFVHVLFRRVSTTNGKLWFLNSQWTCPPMCIKNLLPTDSKSRVLFLSNREDKTRKNLVVQVVSYVLEYFYDIGNTTYYVFHSHD